MSEVGTGVNTFCRGCQEVIFAVAWQRIWPGVAVKRYPASWVIGGQRQWQGMFFGVAVVEGLVLDQR
eukprot:12647186-Ditylum_brightwellii.AAC.1